MSNGDLLKALCPDPDEWGEMKPKDFQERVGKCLGYLLQRDQNRIAWSSVSSFIGGIIGGITAFLGIKGGL